MLYPLSYEGKPGRPGARTILSRGDGPPSTLVEAPADICECGAQGVETAAARWSRESSS